jgi:hypothetical protein
MRPQITYSKIKGLRLTHGGGGAWDSVDGAGGGGGGGG